MLGGVPGSRRVDSKGGSIAEAGEGAKIHLAFDGFAAPGAGGAVVGREPDEWTGTGAGILGSAGGGWTNDTFGPRGHQAGERAVIDDQRRAIRAG